MSFSQLSVFLLAVMIAGCADVGDGEPWQGQNDASVGVAAPNADQIVAAPGASGEGFGDPTRAINGVYGAGDHAGSQDVYSLALPPAENISLTLRWSGRRVMNGPGDDFVVFENGFRQRGSDAFFMDLILVELSQDGDRWVIFPHDYVAPDEREYAADPIAWPGFAGRWPTLLNRDTNPVDPFWTERAGGDPFDLDQLPDDGGLASDIRRDGFVFLRLVAAPARINPDTGEPFVYMTISDGPDIDGVVARYLQTDAAY